MGQYFPVHAYEFGDFDTSRQGAQLRPLVPAALASAAQRPWSGRSERTVTDRVQPETSKIASVE
ncbi:hypothetical protein GCM10010430_62470 [Kitasatospora cystarginea]|uniref:Uncharacterized protein n=1 Tax=Kitasatospora cystarginea TaxID=58350 RepID=A0ABN3ERM6_9ACTN